MARTAACSPQNEGALLRWTLFSALFVLLFLGVPLDFTYTVKPHLSSAEIYAMSQNGSLQRQVIITMLGVVGLATVFRRLGSSIGIRGALPWSILLFFLWAMLSALWSDDLWLTVRRLASMLLSALGALAFAEKFSLRRMISFTLFGCSAIVLLSLAAELSLGTFTPFGETYRFAGLTHPNDQGRTCATLLIAFLARAGERGGGSGRYYLGAVVTLVFLLMTKSRTALFSVLAAAALFFLLKARDRRLVGLVLILAACAACTAAIVFGKDLFSFIGATTSIGRPDFDLLTLTGRVNSWGECLRYFEEHPWLGYGYGGFWTPQRAYEFREANFLGSAHSTYIDLSLDLGLVGLVLSLLMVLLALREARLRYARSGRVEYLFACTIIAWLLINSFTETVHPPFMQLPVFLFISILARLGFVESFLQGEPKPARLVLGPHEVHRGRMR